MFFLRFIEAVILGHSNFPLGPRIARLSRPKNDLNLGTIPMRGMLLIENGRLIYAWLFRNAMFFVQGAAPHRQVDSITARVAPQHATRECKEL
jgi:hypothetical protein